MPLVVLLGIVVGIFYFAREKRAKQLGVFAQIWSEDRGRAAVADTDGARGSRRVVRPHAMRGARHENSSHGEPGGSSGGDPGPDPEPASGGPLMRFVIRQFRDFVRFVGAIVVMSVFVPVLAVSAVLGRWRAAEQVATMARHEISVAIRSCYRLALGNFVTLLGLNGLTELTRGIETRVANLASRFDTAAPIDTPAKRTGLKPMFPGYRVVGTLKGGGSGGKLYIAQPLPAKAERFKHLSGKRVDKVVIKSFGLHEGSSLPQIVRENRALDAAKKLGLVLEHELTPERFYYVMRFVPGDSLSVVTKRLHKQAGEGGLDDKRLRSALGFVRDLLETLAIYHEGGLWHKDVKPENIIVDGDTAHLVDLGLVTPLRSAMTLTTHGTEYFRDPELVRRALRGEKVHDVDCTRFDIYAAGAVLYSLVENSFPAHGALSDVSKRCPSSTRWIIRRSMADFEKRYGSATEMLADIDAILSADDLESVTPAALPSMKGGAADRAARDKDSLIHDPGPAERRSASEQRRAARARMQETRRRASKRMSKRRNVREQERERSRARGLIMLVIVVVGVGTLIRIAEKKHPVSVLPDVSVSTSADVEPDPVPLFDASMDDEIDSRSSSGAGVFTPGPTGAARLAAAGAGLLRDQFFNVEQRVLVVSSLPTPLSDEDEQKIAPVIDRLRTLGYRVVADPIEPDIEDGEPLLVAEAIRIRSQRSASSSSVESDIGDWLNQTLNADFVLWLDPSGDDEGPELVLHDRPAPPGDAVSRAIHAARVSFLRSLIFDAG